jgi:DNA polymerase type B, organellar and viral
MVICLAPNPPGARVVFPFYESYNSSYFHPSFTGWKQGKKQFFPYEYISNEAVFSETSLPPISEFFNTLTNCAISQEDYDYATEVFNALPVRTLGEYIDYYLTVDVLLLTDIMEEFRRTSLEQFQLDPAFFYTLAGFSFAAAFKYTKQEVGLIQDQSMYSLIKSSLRGGICSAITKHSESNNEFLEGGYNPEKGPALTSLFLDFNGLYTFVMTTFPLVKGGYRWLEGEEFDDIHDRILEISRDSIYGYVLCVDLDYPEELHEKHNSLPFCVEHLQIGKSRKLTPNLYNKRLYTIHYRLLQQAMKHGLILRKVHKIIEFEQSHWLSSYITQCALLRSNPVNTDFQKSLYKNLSNIIYGKMLQQSDKFKTVKILRDWKCKGKKDDAVRYLANARFKSFTIFDEDLVAVELQREKVVCDRPIMLGFSILELSKYHLYEFFYDFLLLRIEPSIVDLAYIDTDSMLLSFKDLNPYQFMKNNENFFDTSDFPEKNVHGLSLLNHKIPGLMHDESKGQCIVRFIIEGPKAYIIVLRGSDGCLESKKKLKSVSRHVTKSLEFRDFYHAFESREEAYV